MEAPQTTPATLTDAELLARGRELSVRILSGQDGNQVVTERVFVRLLPVRDYAKLREALLDECQMIELACAQEAGWADRLHPDSHEELITEIRRLNHHFFACWLPRRIATEEQFRSGVMDQFMAEAARQFAKEMRAPSTTGSVTSPPARAGIKHSSPS